MGVSALEGYVIPDSLANLLEHEWIHFCPSILLYRYRTGVRAAVDWLFIRVQNSRR